ncbi:MAG TPA: hypothetical protein VLQ93_02135 [Myxococcaceae bacterium]|nr:hypothetical protein [Myxococcaceae bacterium]
MRTIVLGLLLIANSAFASGTTVKVRCPEDCSVKLDGKTGLRLSDDHWEFKDVEPGKRRIEVKGLLGRHLASGYADIPKAAGVSVFLDHRGRFGVRKEEASTSPAPRKGTKGGKASVLHIRCQKPCRISVDHIRKGGSQSTHSVTVRDVEPGTRLVEASFLLGATRRENIEVPPGSDVYLMASDSGLKVTNSRPLGK